VKVEVAGSARLASTLRKYGGDLDNLTRVNTQIGRYVAVAAGAAAPRRSGTLAHSVAGRGTRSGAVITSRLAYAAPVHWGWPGRHIDARPFMSDAAAATEPTWVDWYFQEIVRLMQQVEGA
jgi:phage gpG-like protein